jgi:hypothetical protein
LNLLLKTPFHSIVTTKFVPSNLRGDPPKPPEDATTKVVQPIIPYHRPFMRPLNYHEYKKDYDPNVHVRVFKATIKANNEMVDEETTNMFNFTLRNNTSNWCNNYMGGNPNCRFTNLEQAFYRRY